MRDPFSDIAAALVELEAVKPPAGGGSYEVENMGGGLYRLGVRIGDTFTPSSVIARPIRMARTLRALVAHA